MLDDKPNFNTIGPGPVLGGRVVLQACNLCFVAEHNVTRMVVVYSSDIGP